MINTGNNRNRWQTLQFPVWGFVLLVLVSACTPARQAIDHDAMPVISGDKGVDNVHAAQRTIDSIASASTDPAAVEALLISMSELADAPLFKDSRTQLLIDGPATYQEMFKAISAAEQFIYLETYIFAEDQVGRDFSRALKEKARQGVDVRVIFDSVGSLSSSSEFFESMREAGIAVIEYHKLNPVEGGNPLDLNVRDHRKLLIVDHEVAFTGGINFSSVYSSGSAHPVNRDRLTEGWRDTHIAIRGPAITAFADIFEENWVLQGGKKDFRSAHLPLPEKAGNELIAALHATGGDGRESSIYRAYIEAIRLARNHVWITQAYFAPDREFMEQLKHAAGRGVDVRIIVPGFSDSSMVLAASRARYKKLLEAGIRIFENNSSLLHAKTAVIDGVWSTVGSSNLDSRSFIHNDEVNAIVFGTYFAGQMEAQFVADMEKCQEITLAAWRKRPLRERFREWLARPFEYWL